MSSWTAMEMLPSWSGRGGPFGAGYKVTAFGDDVTHSGGRLISTLDAGSFWFATVTPNRTLGVELRADF